MKNKFIIGILTGFFLPAILLFLFLVFGVNQENLNFESKYHFVNGKEMVADNQTKIVAILNTDCPGKYHTTPALVENIEKLRSDSIQFTIVADELYDNKIDAKLDAFKEEFDLNETIYLMDINTYPKNSGILNAKRRYDEFVKDISKSDEYIPLGYVNYLIIKNGKLIKFTPKLSEEDLALLKE